MPATSRYHLPRTRIALAAANAALMSLLGILFFRGSPKDDGAPDSTAATQGGSVTPLADVPATVSGFLKAVGRSPERTVANRLAVFARKRLVAAERLAERAGLEVPVGVREFFTAVETSDWPRAQALYLALLEQRGPEVNPRPPALDAVWMAVHETFGVAEIAAGWAAPALIQYAEAVLDSIPAGAIYLGGSDAGRFAPLLFNDVGGVDDKIILTQNALAATDYLDYIGVLHGERLAGLTRQDSQTAFLAYMTDAQRRAEHDRDLPEEPPQLRPGEVVNLSPDGSVAVSGQVAVMSINEELLRSLMARNPELRFVVEQPYPLKGLNSDAIPHGPLLELRSEHADPAALAQRATESLEIWRAAAERLQADVSQPPDSESRRAWSELATAQARFFADQGLPKQAEETYRRALEISPRNVSAIFGLTEQLVQSQRREEALGLVEAYVERNPPEGDNLADLLHRLARRP